MKEERGKPGKSYDNFVSLSIKRFKIETFYDKIPGKRREFVFKVYGNCIILLSLDRK